MVLNIKDKDRLIKRDVFEKPVDAGINPPREPAAQLYTTGRTTPEDFVGSSESVYTHNDSQGAVKDEMNVNSKLWWDAKAAGDTEWMKSLEAANQQLAALLGDGVKFTPSTGKWSGVADVPASTQASMNTGVSVKQPTYDYNEWAASNPQPTYQSAYDAEIDALMNQLLNREKFSYDAESDPLFQQYKNIYSREGNRSMNDTLAAAASGAGGMSSYAMTAAQQANNYYMAQLGDKIPELKQLAYDMYLNDLDLQRQDVGMLMDMENMDYGRYRDSMSDWQNDRSFGYNMYRDQMGDYKWGTSFNYDASRDAINDQWRQTEWDYGLSRDQIEDEWRQKQWDYGVGRDALEDEWRQKEWDYNTSLGSGSGGSGGGSGGSGGGSGYTGGGGVVDTEYTGNPQTGGADNGGLSAEQIKAAQKYYGVTADGKWGPKSQAAAGGMNAYDAWMAMSDKTFWGGVNNLGLGPRAASVIDEIAEYGGVVENPDGSVSWASGWNAGNYMQKLEEAKKANPLQASYDLFGGFEEYLEREKKKGNGANNNQYKYNSVN